MTPVSIEQREVELFFEEVPSLRNKDIEMENCVMDHVFIPNDSPTSLYFT